MATFRRFTFKLPTLSLRTQVIQPLSFRYFSSMSSTKHYRNLTDQEKALVEQLIDNAPGSDIGMTNLMTGKGIDDAVMKEKHTQLQKTMMAELTKQFPTSWDRIRFFAIYLKNMITNLKKMNDSKKELNATIKGAAIKHNLVDHSFQGIVLTKTLIQMYGNQKGSQMLSNAQKRGAPLFNESIINYLESKVPHPLRFAVVNGINKKVLSKSVAKEGIFDIDWIDDDIYSKQFEFHVKRCLFRDVGKVFGDTDDAEENNLTYTWFCQFDDKMLPDLGKYAEFEFKREGTLAKGCKYCDFKFSHI